MAEIVKFILILMAAAPRAEINVDEKFRQEIAGYIEHASDDYYIDPLWLTYSIYKESSFRVGVTSKSKLKEFGLCQVHGRARDICEGLNINLATARGQVRCMAALFEHGRLLCGSKRKSAYWYMSGQCSPSKKVREKYKSRVKFYNKKVRKLIQGY